MDKITEKELLLIKESKDFDGKWYCDNYPDVGKSGISPALHFLKYGRKLNRKAKPSNSLGGKYEKSEKKFLNEKRNSLLDDYSERVELRKKAFYKTIKRSGLVGARDLLLFNLSRKKVLYRDYIRALEDFGNLATKELASSVLNQIEPKAHLEIAELLVGQNLLIDDRYMALNIFQYVYETAGVSVFSRRQSKTWIELLLVFSCFDKASELIGKLKIYASERKILRMDLANLHYLGDDFNKWYREFKKIFEAIDSDDAELLISNAHDELPTFKDLSARVERKIYKGDKITVVVSCYCPNDLLITSVKSILNQTWVNTEVIVVDDASPSEYDSVLNQCVQLDSRVKLIKQNENGGTYIARNVAMCAATGKYITFQDSDDWSHPRRLELQIRYMQNNEDTVACRGYGLRAYDDFAVYSLLKENVSILATNLFFEREKVINSIGYYDAIRKSADGEYMFRIEAYFEQPIAELEKDLILQIYRTTPDSLSSNEFKPGWRHPSRTAYRESYQYWHRNVSSKNDLYLEQSPETRPCFAPLRFRSNTDKKYYDVVFIGDWASLGGPQYSMMEEIKAVLDMGLKVAICHLHPLRMMSSQPIFKIEMIQLLINQGLVDEVVLDDQISTSLVILRYPLILQFAPFQKAKWSIGRFYILVNQAPMEQDGTDIRYKVTDCNHNCFMLFNIEPIWLPMGPLVRKALLSMVPPNMMYHSDCPGILNPTDWHLSNEFVSTEPVIGRYSRDNIMKFPESKDDMLKGYVANHESIKVRIMGGDKSCRHIISEEVPGNWELIPYKSVEVKKFLSTIDFFVYLDHEHIVEAFGRSILEAIASKKVVILPYKFQDVFGDGAIYAAPNEVEGIVMDLYYDRSKYLAQVDKALEVVNNKFSHQSYKNWMKGEIKDVKVLP